MSPKEQKLMIIDPATGLFGWLTLGPAGTVLALPPTPALEPEMELLVVAGNAGVYVGWVRGGLSALTGERVITGFGRHLRHYYVAGRQGDGSALDLACRGVDWNGSSISDAGWFRVADVFRVFVVAPDAIASFRVPKPGEVADDAR